MKYFFDSLRLLISAVLEGNKNITIDSKIGSTCEPACVNLVDTTKGRGEYGRECSTNATGSQGGQ